MRLITKPVVLWGLFAAAIALYIGLLLWTPLIGGTALDNISSAEEIRSLLAEMSDVQKSSHVMMTLVLDIAFPLAYGFLFAGLILKFSGRLGMWLALPAFVVIPMDIMENIIQLMALIGNETLLPVKELITPLKLGLFILSGLLAIGSIVFNLIKNKCKTNSFLKKEF